MRGFSTRLGATLAVLMAVTATVSAAPPDIPAVKAAIERGSNYIRMQYSQYTSAGSGGAIATGRTAFGAIALIEAGVPPNDPTLVAIVQAVRKASIDLTKTYELSLYIILLDKYSDPVDTDLIQAMGVRLLAGQTRMGGWGYDCPPSDGRVLQRLNGSLNGATMRAGAAPRDTTGIRMENRPPLAGDLADQVRNRGTFAPPAGAGHPPEDNSNTQFAILGLWTARRHGVPVEETITAAANRFRRLQNQNNGGWAYGSDTNIFTTPSMTCAGLFALAAGFGNSNERILKARGAPTSGGKNDFANPGDKPKGGSSPASQQPRDPNTDPAVRAALNYLGVVLRTNSAPAGGTPGGPGGMQGPGAGAGGPGAIGGLPGLPGGPGGGPGRGPAMPGGGPGAGGIHENLYLMWSIERVAMLYNLNTIGGIDWYEWGWRPIVRMQRQDGSWAGSSSWYGTEMHDVATAFAMLFLLRANLASDLTGMMKGGTTMKAKGTLPQDNPLGTVKKPTEKPLETGADVAAAIMKAEGTKQAELIAKFKDEKGALYTEGLSLAIHKLTGDTQKAARDALAERLARMKADYIRVRLKDLDPEMRRAAALACAMRDDKEHVNDLIPVIVDPEEIVWRAARLALKSLTSQDFGPPAGSTPAERTKAANDWREWWKKQGGS